MKVIYDTKFDIDDIVYFIDDNKIQEGCVEAFEVSIHHSLGTYGDPNPWFYETKYWVDGSEPRNGDELYATPEELFNAIKAFPEK